MLYTIVLLLFDISSAHDLGPFDHDAIVNRLGVMVSLEQPPLGGPNASQFAAFEAWSALNTRLRSSNVSYVVRLEFEAESFKQSRLVRYKRRFKLPGVLAIKLASRQRSVERLNKRLGHNQMDHDQMEHDQMEHDEQKGRVRSHLDAFVFPDCFLRNHGPNRFLRVAKVIGMGVAKLKWLAKIVYNTNQTHDNLFNNDIKTKALYSERAMVEVARLTAQEVPGINCAWLHPSTGKSSFSMMLRFHSPSTKLSEDTLPSLLALNNKFAVRRIRYVQDRALIDFEAGLSCSNQSPRLIAEEYKRNLGKALKSVHLDFLNHCHFVYRITLLIDNIDHDEMYSRQVWMELNRLYGVVHVLDEIDQTEVWRKTLLFEPGLYSLSQMHSIRDEYAKLPHVLLGFVTGQRLTDIDALVLNFKSSFVQRIPLSRYHYWNSLNSRLNAQVFAVERQRAFIRMPRMSNVRHGRALFRRYRHLPGVKSIQIDFDYNASQDFSLPPPRSMRSWIKLTDNGKGIVGEGQQDVGRVACAAMS